jgi:hypothetical protein
MAQPPFDRYQVAHWIRRLADYGTGTVLVHARTEAEWFEPIWEKANCIGFLNDRIYFHYPDGRRADANSGAPAVLATFGMNDEIRLRQSGIEMNIVTHCIKKPWSAPLRPKEQIST